MRNGIKGRTSVPTTKRRTTKQKAVPSNFNDPAQYLVLGRAYSGSSDVGFYVTKSAQEITVYPYANLSTVEVVCYIASP